MTARDDLDAALEARIQAAYDAWLETYNGWPELVELIKQRSPQQVARMERERGLT